MNRTRRSRAPLLLTLVVSGCTVGPDFEKPKTDTPATWAGLDRTGAAVTSIPDTGPATIVRWWDQFNDPTLTGLIERATSANLSLAQAEARIREARAARTIVGSAQYPSVDASLDASRSRSGSFDNANTRNLFRGGFDATWELDLFGGVRRTVEAADAQVESAIYDRHAVMVSLVGEVATTYLDIRGSQRQLAIARENLEAQQQTLDLTSDRLEAGYVTALDVANAKANVTQTASQIPALDAALHASIFSMSVLLGEQPGALLPELLPDGHAPVPPASVPVGLPSELLLRRPDIRRAEADLHAATARVGVAVADQYPRIAINGSIGTQGNQVASLGTLADRFWSIGPAISMPIFTGGRVQGGIEQARAVAEQSLIAYRSTVLTAFQEVETSLVNFTREQERRAWLVESVEANRQAVELSLLLYSAGRTDFLNVLTAQRQLRAIESSLAQSDTAVGSNLIAIYKALGGGWQPDSEPGPSPSPSAPQPAQPPAQPPAASAEPAAAP